MPKTYSSDLTPSQFARIEPLIRYKKVTKPIKVDLHQVMNGILYQLKNGCVWSDLPENFPNYKTVFYHYSNYKRDGILDKILTELTVEYRLHSEKKRVTNFANN